VNLRKMLQHAVQFAALAETASELRQPRRRIFDVLLAAQQDRYDRGDPARRDDAGQPVETLIYHGKARVHLVESHIYGSRE
jgi:hypothetical protein